jgi:hypothetical protein
MVLAPLQFSGRSLTPDVLGGIQQGQQVSQGENILQQQRLGIQGTQQEQGLAQQQAQQTAAAQQQAQGLLARKRAGAPAGEINAEIADLLFTQPDVVKKLRAEFKLDNEAKVLRAAQLGLNVELAAGNRQQQDEFLQQQIKTVEAEGGDASQSRQLLAMSDDQRLQAAKLLQAQAFSREELAVIAGKSIEQQRKPVDPLLVEQQLTSAGFVKGSPPFQNALKQILGVDPQAQQKEQTEAQLKADLKASDTSFDRAKKLRAEITTASAEFNKINSAFGRIEASSEDPSAAGDLALIFNFMKMLDPGSVVRESEFATAANAAGVPERVRNQFNKVVTGERLGVTQRADFLNQAKKIFDRSSADNVKAIDKIIDIGEQFGVSKAQLVGREQEEEQPVIQFDRSGKRVQ